MERRPNYMQERQIIHQECETAQVWTNNDIFELGSKQRAKPKSFKELRQQDTQLEIDDND